MLRCIGTLAFGLPLVLAGTALADDAPATQPAASMQPTVAVQPAPAVSAYIPPAPGGSYWDHFDEPRSQAAPVAYLPPPMQPPPPMYGTGCSSNYGGGGGYPYSVDSSSTPLSPIYNVAPLGTVRTTYLGQLGVSIIPQGGQGSSLPPSAFYRSSGAPSPIPPYNPPISAYGPRFHNVKIPPAAGGARAGSAPVLRPGH